MFRRTNSEVNKFNYAQLETKRLLAADFSNPDVYDLNREHYSNMLEVAGNLVVTGVEDLEVGNEIILIDAETLQRRSVEVHSGPTGNPIRLLGADGNNLFFTAVHPTDGIEVHWFDVTLNNPQIHHVDATPGPGSTDPREFSAAEGHVFFRHTHSSLGSEFFTFDTSVGQSSLRFFDINPGVSHAFPYNFTVANNRVFFSAANNGNYRRDIYWLDLDDPNSSPVEIDVNLGGTLTKHSEFSLHNGRLFYGETYSGSNQNLFAFWIDPAAAEPAAVPIEVDSANPQLIDADRNFDLHIAGDIGFFEAHIVGAGTELFWIDLNATNPEATVIDINQGNSGFASSRPSELKAVGDLLFFSAETADVGEELRWIDTTASLNEVNAIDVSPGDADSNPVDLTVSNDKIFFNATSSAGKELHWVDLDDLSLSPGTVDFHPGTLSSDPQRLTAANGRVFFYSEGPDESKVRWIAADEPTTVNTFDDGPTSFAPLPIEDKLFFFARFGEEGHQLRWIDTLDESPELMTELFAAGVGYTNFVPQVVKTVNGRTYIKAIEYDFASSTTYPSLYWIDENASPSAPNKVNIPFSDDVTVEPALFTAVNDKVFFTDWTSSSTLLWINAFENDPVVHEIELPDSTDGDSINTAVYGDRLFIATSRGIVWVDTSESSPIVNEVPGLDSDYFPYLFNQQPRDFLLFRADDTASGNELRWLDPFASVPTIQTFDVNAGAEDSVNDELIELTEISGNFYFFANSELHGLEMRWIDTHGTSPIVRTIDVYPGTDSSFPESGIVQVQNDVCIAATVDLEQRDIICFDPTESNPALNTIVTPTSAHSLESTGTKIFYRGFDDDHGYEVRWIDISLPTPIEQVVDANPGAAGSIIDFSSNAYENSIHFTQGDRLFLSAYDPDHGHEIRWIDATQESPDLQTLDVWPGQNDGNFELQFVDGDNLYFTAEDPIHGHELRQVSLLEDSPTWETIDIVPGPYPERDSNPDANIQFVERFGNELFFFGPLVGFGTELFSVVTETSIANQSIFYDGATVSQTADSPLDEETAAPDKTPLLPGETATFENYISYEKGINGISLYFNNLAEVPTLDNWSDFFEFRVGNDDSFASPGWTAAPDPIGIEIDSLESTDRVNIRWADYSIMNQWLEIRTLANEFTGLTEPDVHYWGSAVGDTGNSATDALVNASDVSGVRNNLSGFFSVGINNDYDMNRDGRVDATDIGIVRNNLSGFFGLTLISPPAGGSFNVVNSRTGFDERFSMGSQFIEQTLTNSFDANRITLAHPNRLSGAVRRALEDNSSLGDFKSETFGEDEKPKPGLAEPKVQLRNAFDSSGKDSTLEHKA